MKVQEVILKAMAGSLKWWEAAEIIGVTDRTMRRWRERYEEGGYYGLYDRRKRRPSPKRVALKSAERVLQLYREKYFDFNVRHFPRKLVSSVTAVSFTASQPSPASVAALPAVAARCPHATTPETARTYIAAAAAAPSGCPPASAPAPEIAGDAIAKSRCTPPTPSTPRTDTCSSSA